jgi:hypothetical protein
MKFITKLVTLLAATAAYAVPVNEKREEAGLCDQYIDCFHGEDVTSLNFESVCNTFNEKKCLDTFNNNYETFEKAYKECTAAKRVETYNMSMMKLLCSKDESGNYCTLGKSFLENRGRDTKDPIVVQIIKDNCKSKVCTDIYKETLEESIEMYKNMKDGDRYKDIVEEIKEEIVYLNSTECTSQAQASSQNTIASTNQAAGNTTQADNKAQSSDASSLTYSSTLLVATILLLSTLL